MSVDHMMEIAHNENMMQMQTGDAGNDEECYSSFIGRSAMTGKSYHQISKL